MILSDGTKYENIRPLKTRIKELKYNQRQLSKNKGKHVKKETTKEIASVHQKVKERQKGLPT